jgi:hypothetical protein
MGSNLPFSAIRVNVRFGLTAVIQQQSWLVISLRRCCCAVAMRL